MYTSGTTGRPKGVVRSHLAEIVGSMTMAVEVGFRHEDVILHNKPLFHIAQFHLQLMPFIQIGGTNVAFGTVLASLSRAHAFDIHGITVAGDTQHNNSLTLRANVAPKLMHQLCVAAMAGKAQEAMAIQRQLLNLHKHMFIEANPIPVKWAVARMGKCGGTLRLPMTPLSSQLEPLLEAALRKNGLI